MKHFCLSTLLAFSSLFVLAQPINRKAVVQRHKVIVTKADSLSSLTVGNGRFAFTVDVTGLQTYPSFYEKGVSLGTQSEWGWHSFIDTIGYSRDEALKTYQLNGRPVTYTVQWNSPERNKAVSNWFRQNPHRLQLGNLGFQLLKKDGTEASVSELKDIHQELDPWTGLIQSRFSLEGIPVNVQTYCHPEADLIAVRISSPLIKEGRLKVRMRFPYPTGAWTDEGNNHSMASKHRSLVLLSHVNGAVLLHQLDTTKYYIGFSWPGKGVIREVDPHDFILTPGTDSVFSFSARFNPKKDFGLLPDFSQTKASSIQSWNAFWTKGGAIDFSGSTDPRAKELERRMILSRYLLRAQEAGSYPPQETGLTYNSWFGKPHLEMVWWHATHYALWGQIDLLEKCMDWYREVSGKAYAIAKRQGYEGLRWQKMTDNNGDEAPSSVGAFLIWQQPHFIYFAELCYRDKKNQEVLEKYKDLVFATADFMASFPVYDKVNDRYVLGKGLIPAQERFKAEETFNPGYELVYWKWALNVAQQWRIKLGLPRNRKWDEVMNKLSPLAVQDGLYLATESAKDSYANPEFRTDHPSILAALGVMPKTGQVDTSIMNNTFNWIWKNWSWKETWGWDFPMVAMTATRLGQPEKAIEALLMKVQTNTYLINGHNYQDERLRIYLPGNGGLLTALAMMVAGYDNAPRSLPGIPKNGQWKVRWEGLKRMP